MTLDELKRYERKTVPGFTFKPTEGVVFGQTAVLVYEASTRLDDGTVSVVRRIAVGHDGAVLASIFLGSRREDQ